MRKVRLQKKIVFRELITYTNRVLGSKQKRICVSRPRRFGKSMAAEMLSAYYDKSCDSEELFRHTKISQNNTFKKYLNEKSNPPAMLGRIV